MFRQFVFYYFKTGNYSFRIIDPESEDGCFRAYYSENEGGVVDTYEDDVVHFFNTQTRLDNALRQEVDPLIDKHLDKKKITVDAVTLGEEFGFATCFVEGVAQKEIDACLSLDMKADAKNIPIPTQIVLSLHTDEAESFRRAMELAGEISALGYSIDFYDFYTSGNYYQMVPTEKLLKAKSVDDLEEFIMDDYDIPKED